MKVYHRFIGCSLLVFVSIGAASYGVWKAFEWAMGHGYLTFLLALLLASISLWIAGCFTFGFDKDKDSTNNSD